METLKENKKEAIIARIKKLLEHAESAKTFNSLAEAESFTAMATKLLLEYNLEMSEVEAAKDNNNEFKHWKYNEPILYKDNQSGNRWKLLLVTVLANHNFCDLTNNPYKKEFRVYGNIQNVDTVTYLYNYLSVGLLRLAQEHYNQLDTWEKHGYNRYAYLKDFLLGAVKGVNAKLQEQKDFEAQKNSKVTALVLYNDKALAKYAEEVITGLKKGRKPKTITVGHGYGTGYKVGKNYKINGPLTAGKKEDLLKLEDK